MNDQPDGLMGFADMVIVPPGYQYVDQGVANSAIFVDALGLRWHAEASIQYMYESLILSKTSPEARFRYRVRLPAGAVMASNAPYADVTNTLDGTEVTIWADPQVPHRGRGLIDMGGISGEVRIQFAQAKVHNSATILKAGSWIRLTALPLEEVSEV